MITVSRRRCSYSLQLTPASLTVLSSAYPKPGVPAFPPSPWKGTDLLHCSAAGHGIFFFFYHFLIPKLRNYETTDGPRRSSQGPQWPRDDVKSSWKASKRHPSTAKFTSKEEVQVLSPAWLGWPLPPFSPDPSATHACFCMLVFEPIRSCPPLTSEYTSQNIDGRGRGFRKDGWGKRHRRYSHTSGGSNY